MNSSLMLRRAFFHNAVLIFGLVVCSGVFGEQPGNDWPTFLGPNGNGKSTETGILKDWSGGKLKLLWKLETGEGYGMGSEADGRFYHFGSKDGQAKLVCVSSQTGELVWEFKYKSEYQDLYGYDSGPRASPVIDQDRIYIYGVEGMLHCLDKESGSVNWKLNVNEKFGVIQNFFGVSSTPIVFNDLLIVMVGGSPDKSKSVPPGALDRVEPNGTGVVAFDKKTGEVKYKVVNDLASYCSLTLVDLNGEKVLLAWMRESLYGLAPTSGDELFKFPWRARKLESVNASTPVVIENDKVFISECYERGSALLKIGGESGKQLENLIWSDKGKRKQALQAHWNTPVVLGDSLFGCSGRHSAPAELRCIDWATGKVHWSEKGLSRSSLTYIDGHFVVLGEMGDLILIEASKEKFKLVTKYTPASGSGGIKFRSPCWAAPVISDGRMFVRGKDQMACFQLIPKQ